MDDFNISSQNGLSLNGKPICNAVPEITGVYFAPGEEEPAMVEVSVSVGNLNPKRVVVPPEDLDFKHLHAMIPHLRCGNVQKKNHFDEFLMHLYICALEGIQKGDL